MSPSTRVLKRAVKTIAVCASVSFYKDVVRIERTLKTLGYTVLIPTTARRMAETGDFDTDKHKSWYTNPDDYDKKRALMEEHFAKIVESDAILVVNNEKHGMHGYIGGNVLMEMAIALHYNKKIFVLHPIADSLTIKEEIYGMQPTFLNGVAADIQKHL